MASRLVQLRNVSGPMLVTLAGRVTLVRLKQNPNASGHRDSTD